MRSFCFNGKGSSLSLAMYMQGDSLLKPPFKAINLPKCRFYGIYTPKAQYSSTIVR